MAWRRMPHGELAQNKCSSLIFLLPSGDTKPGDIWALLKTGKDWRNQKEEPMMTSTTAGPTLFNSARPAKCQFFKSQFWGEWRIRKIKNYFTRRQFLSTFSTTQFKIYTGLPSVLRGLPEAISTQPSQMGSSSILIHQSQTGICTHSNHMAIDKLLCTVNYGHVPSEQDRGNNLKGSWYKGRSYFGVGWDMQIRMRRGCSSAVRVCCVLFGKWDKIFLWSATLCDIPTHTLLLTFYLPLNSPTVVTFSGFLIYVLQDLKSDGRNF